MSNNDLGCVGINAFQYVLVAVQTQETLQTISLVLSIISTIIILTMKVIDWYKKAKADGKITKDEIKQLHEDVKDDVEKVVDDIKQVSHKDEKKE